MSNLTKVLFKGSLGLKELNIFLFEPVGKNSRDKKITQ